MMDPDEELDDSDGLVVGGGADDDVPDFGVLTVVTTTEAAKEEQQEEDCGLTRSSKRVVLILSKTRRYIHQWLSSSIDTVLFCSSESLAKITAEDRSAYLAVVGFDSYDTTGLLEWKALHMHKEIPFTHVVGLSEEDLVRSARLRRTLGIEVIDGYTGRDRLQSLSSALLFCDKVAVKRRIITAGHAPSAVPAFAEVNSPADLFEFLETHSLPCVIKARRGWHSGLSSSGGGATVLRTGSDVRAALGGPLFAPRSALDLTVEKFVSGDLYHVDGLKLEGTVSLCWPSLSMGGTAATAMADMPLEFTGGHSLSPENPLRTRLQKFVVGILLSLGGPTTFPFHAEVWHTHNGDLVMCNIAPRTGGGGIRYEMRALFNVSLDKIWAQAQAQDEITDVLLTNSSHIAGWSGRIPEGDEGDLERGDSPKSLSGKKTRSLSWSSTHSTSPRRSPSPTLAASNSFDDTPHLGALPQITPAPPELELGGCDGAAEAAAAALVPEPSAWKHVGWCHVFPPRTRETWLLQKIPHECPLEYCEGFYRYAEAGTVGTDAVCCIVVRGASEAEVALNVRAASNWVSESMALEKGGATAATDAAPARRRMMSATGGGAFIEPLTDTNEQCTIAAAHDKAAQWV